MTDKRVRLLAEELLVYLEDINREAKGKYFPTNRIRLKLKKERAIEHCWKTYQRKLMELEKKGKIESIATVLGPMWRLKNGR